MILKEKKNRVLVLFFLRQDTVKTSLKIVNITYTAKYFINIIRKNYYERFLFIFIVNSCLGLKINSITI
jgi:hypothetical protein